MVRKSKRVRRTAGGIGQLPWRQPVNPYPPLNILSDDQVEAINLASLSLLEDYGMRVLHEGARDLLAAAGADVDTGSQMVRFDRGMVRE